MSTKSPLVTPAGAATVMAVPGPVVPLSAFTLVLRTAMVVESGAVLLEGSATSGL